MQVRTSSGDSLTREIVEAAPESFGDAVKRVRARHRLAGLVRRDAPFGDAGAVSENAARVPGAFPRSPQVSCKVLHVEETLQKYVAGVKQESA
jgi:hypothetical protein